MNALQRSLHPPVALEDVEQLKVLGPKLSTQLLWVVQEPLTTRYHTDDCPVYPIFTQSGPNMAVLIFKRLTK